MSMYACEMVGFIDAVASSSTAAAWIAAENAALCNDIVD